MLWSSSLTKNGNEAFIIKRSAEFQASATKKHIFSLNWWGFLTRNYVPEKRKRWRSSNMRSFPPFFEGNVDEKEISLITGCQICHTLFSMLIWVTCGLAALPSFGWAEKTRYTFHTRKPFWTTLHVRIGTRPIADSAMQMQTPFLALVHHAKCLWDDKATYNNWRTTTVVWDISKFTLRFLTPL